MASVGTPIPKKTRSALIPDIDFPEDVNNWSYLGHLPTFGEVIGAVGLISKCSGEKATWLVLRGVKAFRNFF